MKKKMLLILSCVLLFSCSSESGVIPPVDGGTDDEPVVVVEEEEEEEETPPPPVDENANFRDIPVPAEADAGMVWQFQEDISDDFDYSFNSTEREAFGPSGQWTNFFHNGWEGPGPTRWRHENVTVDNGFLNLNTTRVEGEMKSFDFNGESLTRKATRLGCVSSNVQIVFPVYIESRVKIPNAVTASATWLLSPDDTQEIDFLEAWGGQYDRNTCCGTRQLDRYLHFSHHIFIREPFQDYQPSDVSTWYRNESELELWADDFHRYGVYWRSPTHLEYYLDGVLIKVLDHIDNEGGRDGIDPNNLSSPDRTPGNRTGLNKPMDIIMDMEDQNWRAGIGSSPTDEEILDVEGHTMQIDWIRIFKPVADGN